MDLDGGGIVERRWQPRPWFEVDGLWFKVERGKKAPDDLRLDILAAYRDEETGLVEARALPVSMSFSAILADFFYENENVLYPPPRFKGGKRHSQHMALAEQQGWEVAEALKAEEIAHKRRK